MASSPHRIERSRTDRMIAGVCGGLAEYLGIDATLVRIFFVLLAIGEGVGVLLYVILWLVIPEAEAETRDLGSSVRTGATEMSQQAWTLGNDIRRSALHPHPNTPVVIGIVLILVGIFVLLDHLNIPGLLWLDTDLLWPVLLIIGGIALLLRRGR